MSRHPNKGPANILGEGHGAISKQDTRRLDERIRHAQETGEPLVLFFGTCPDYSHDGERYTFERVGDGVPLLTIKQVEASQALFARLESLGVPFRCRFLLADTEAVDPYFAAKYFGGDSDAFLDTCSRSVAATRTYLGSIALGYSHGTFEASSFFEAFGRDRFSEVQDEYEMLLTDLYHDHRLERVGTDTAGRSRLYRRLYGYQADPDFLAGRTMRTMAQYLTLGELACADPQACFVVHDTVNASLLQSTNVYHRSDTPTLPIMPIIRTDVSVY